MFGHKKGMMDIWNEFFIMRFGKMLLKMDRLYYVVFIIDIGIWIRCAIRRLIYLPDVYL